MGCCEPGLLHAGYSADQQGLLYIRNSIPNFPWYQQVVPCSGWDTDPVGQDDICTWDGVSCNSQLQVTNLNFPWKNALTGDALPRNIPNATLALCLCFDQRSTTFLIGLCSPSVHERTWFVENQCYVQAILGMCSMGLA